MTAAVVSASLPVFRARANGATWIYVIRRPDTGAIKVGRARNVFKRMKAMQSNNDVRLELIVSWRAPFYTEQLIHSYLVSHRKRGEWYVPTPELLDWVERQKMLVTTNASLAMAPGCACKRCGAPLAYSGRGQPPTQCAIWPDCISRDVIVGSRTLDSARGVA